MAVKAKAQKLDKDRANLSAQTGYALPVDFDDREKAHAAVAKEFSPMFGPGGNDDAGQFRVCRL